MFLTRQLGKTVQGSSPRRRLARSRSAFSLIEVVLAVGVVSFALMALIGVLPVGLQTVQDSRVQAARSNIVQQLRGVLQQIPFSSSSSGSNSFDINSLKDEIFYYTEEGMETDSASTAYYRAEFEVENAGMPGSTSATTFDPTNAKMVKVTLSYPQNRPEQNQKHSFITLFSAKQGSN